MKGLNFDADSAFIVDANPKKDTITYWLRDTALINRDSLEIEYSYHITDTLGQLVPQTDTLLMVPKLPLRKGRRCWRRRWRNGRNSRTS